MLTSRLSKTESISCAKYWTPKKGESKDESKGVAEAVAGSGGSAKLVGIAERESVE
ncbi:hypothetical protein HMI55_000613 [Coelomomyces lativittatus]|nr:hypothetical protein HMI55_000613 [Coelomomyces lativittatus]